MKDVRSHIRKKSEQERPTLALLFDPDDCDRDEKLEERVKELPESPVDLILIGGSLLVGDAFERTIDRIRSNSELPIVLFPGSPMQLSEKADATLFLSLISGRNPELLIGQQVLAAPTLKRMEGDVISTGYMLIEGGKSTTATYMSGSQPIPRDKDDIAMATAMAGELMGMNSIYLDAGSGAESPVPPSMIERVSSNVKVPLIVGGGIRSSGTIRSAALSGADMVVVGSAFEEDPSFLKEMESAFRELS